MMYRLLKHVIHFGLFNYHKKIHVYGLENVPKNKPVLFLPNHQNALIDVLLIGVACNRKPYFLARSDVFGGGILNTFFTFLRMIPIYRIRDGRSTLQKNDAIFDSCAEVLGSGEAIVMFPEGNHSLKRRVRPLSKGFTRVLFRAMETSPELDIHLVPVGLNYKRADSFPDSASVYYGAPISVQELCDKDDLQGTAIKIKEQVAANLKTLTTHISPKEQYNEIADYLEAHEIDFLNPSKSNRLIKQGHLSTRLDTEKINKKNDRNFLFRRLFLLVNLPIVLLWRFVIRPKVADAEFVGTFRFAWAFLGFFLYFILLFVVFSFVLNFWWALGIIGLVWVFNIGYVKWLSS